MVNVHHAGHKVHHRPYGITHGLYSIAKKLRHSILKELDAMAKSDSGIAELRQFEKIEAAMSK